MRDATKGLIVWAFLLAVGIGIGLTIGWNLWNPGPPRPETYAREQRQQDGSLVLERKPQEDAKPAQEVPKGGKVERVIQVVVRPAEPVEPLPRYGSDASVPVEPRPPCPPVTVDLSLVRMPDQTRRVIASSPNGTILSGVDIPVEAPPPQKRLRWSVAALRSYEVSTGRQSWGGMVQRDLGPFVVGAGTFGGQVFASVGMRF